jgi:hypothetical protein
MSLKTALKAETHIADGLASKLSFTINVQWSLIIPAHILTESNMEERLTLFLYTLIGKGHQNAAT